MVTFSFSIISLQIHTFQFFFWQDFFVVFLFIQNTHKKEFFGDAIFLLFLNLLSKIVDKSFFSEVLKSKFFFQENWEERKKMKKCTKKYWTKKSALKWPKLA